MEVVSDRRRRKRFGEDSQPRENRVGDHVTRWLAELATLPSVRGVNRVSTNAITREASYFPFLPIDIIRSSYDFRLAVLSSVRGLARVTRSGVVRGWGFRRPRPACVTGKASSPTAAAME